MINLLDEILRELFIHRIAGDITDPSQVSFEFPDEDFRNHVKTFGKNMLNVCLVDLRENRSGGSLPLRQGEAPPERPPRRLDCHYLISAWSPATRNVEPSLDEHALLYKATAALMEADPLVPREVFNENSMPSNFPPSFRDVQLPAVIFPVERFAKSAEFWTASRGVAWKPTIHLVVTLPVFYSEEVQA